jgi:3-hydroxyacyl-CoA dehydrogenase
MEGCVSVVELRRDGAVAVIVLDNPPVNALSHAVRAGLLDALRRTKAERAVEAVVLTGAGRSFSGGFDITEFGKPFQPPGLIELEEACEALGKPIVVAFNGIALGGGLEVPLACHFRVAAPAARLGLPEIKLGLLPGAGGTQRLPRLIGAEKTLRLVTSGDPVPARQALADGLVDAVIEGDLVAGAVAFARQVLAEKRPLRLLRDAPAFGKVEAPGRVRGRAAEACVQSVRNAFELPFEEGMRRERELFVALMASDESRAQRYAFFAEREAAKVPGMPDDVRPREVARAAVVGAGTMGGGIAMSFANAGIPVTLIEASAEALRRGLDTIAANYRRSSRFTPADVEERLARITGVTELEAAADADAVVEAVFEEMDLKKRVFGTLDRIAKPGAMLATNTSYLDVNEIGRATGRPESVLGTHFFSPANVMRLLEIVRGEKTSFETLATALQLGKRLGKVPVVVGVCDGFVGNRMLGKRSIEAERLLLEGALPQDVDAVVTAFGFPMGPFAMGDLAGLDVGMRIRRQRGTRAEIADTLCEMGRYGQKTGAGFYRYEKGSRAPLADPEVEKVIVAASARLGVARRAISKEEILERMLYPMINEGARILEEGIAARPGDIDVIWIYGYGWPAWRGGPMWHAEHVGKARIAARLEHYAALTGDESLRPAGCLRR